jgi:hypothetical protein
MMLIISRFDQNFGDGSLYILKCSYSRKQSNSVNLQGH